MFDIRYDCPARIVDWKQNLSKGNMGCGVKNL
jgi:hypothetical protein